MIPVTSTTIFLILSGSEADLRVEIKELKEVAPQNSEEQHKQFVLKKRVIDTLVERIEIDKDRNFFFEFG
jgi:hypothetical protein